MTCDHPARCDLASDPAKPSLFRPNWLRGACAAVGRWRDNCEGTTAILFALILGVLLLSAGGALDVGRVYRANANAQTAADSAVLSGARDILIRNLAKREDVALVVERFAYANLSNTPLSNASVTVAVEDDGVRATIKGSVETPFLNIVGLSSMEFAVSSKAAISDTKLEIAMVLDTTGSIRVNGHINSISSAVSDLVTDFEALEPKFALVPFSETVNLGEHVKDFWIDSEGRSPTHGIMFDESSSKVVHHSLFSSTGVDWNGCVEMRAMPYDVTDDEPDDGDPATKWVPFFGPAVNPFGNYLKQGYSNVAGVRVARQRSSYTRPNMASVEDPGHPGDRYDPVSNCNRNPIIPLTSNAGSMRQAIGALDFDGGTNIPSGLAWGWRVLSPGEPFAEGAPYSDAKTRKILVLLTDGKNEMGVEYNGYGMFYDRRLGQSGRSWTEMNALVDKRMDQLCQNIKNAGITLYVVSYALASDAETAKHKARMTQCASAPDLHFDAESQDALRDALVRIIQLETPLRLIN